MAVREELWVGGRMIESRLSHGEAWTEEGAIVAIDSADEALLDASARELERLRAALPAAAANRVRLVAEARTDGVSSAIVLSDGLYSVVTTPETLDGDRALLARASSAVPAVRAVDYHGLPIVWTHGSGGVLLHEAAGHPAEHGHPRIGWPEWLEARDGGADLLAGESPRALRRASFSDVPLARMTEVAVSQRGAPSALPARRLEVFLVEGGSYEPLTEMVTVSVAAADLMEDGKAVARLPPFEIRERRADVARSLCGAAGDPVRCPLVVCSREGQELLVASSAPLLVTVFP